MKCPVCGGEMWDNREGKRNPKAPDFKCKDKDCDGVIWPPKKGDEFDQRSAGERREKSAYQKARAEMQQPVNSLDERQRAIIRQHSQSMAIEVLKLKQALGEL